MQPAVTCRTAARVLERLIRVIGIGDQATFAHVDIGAAADSTPVTLRSSSAITQYSPAPGTLAAVDRAMIGGGVVMNIELNVSGL